MKTPMFFFSTGECGCGTAPQTGNATPQCFPVQGALISDNRYLTLATAPTGQMIVVPKGSNSQMFLRGVPGFRGFTFYENEIVYLEKEPRLNLPFVNPQVSNAHPATGTMRAIIVGNGADPMNWHMYVAPTAGSWLLQAKNGSWALVDSGSIPGLNEVGSSATVATKGQLLALVETAPGVFAARKLQVADKRVIVGEITDLGETGYKALPAGSFLEHPKARFPEFQFRTIQAVDVDGNPLVGGLEQGIAIGGGAINDGVGVLYSPATKKLVLRFPHTRSFTKNNTLTASTAILATYQLLPSGHGVAPSQNINYPTVRIDADVKFSTDELLTIGLFRDGILLEEWPLNSQKDTSIFYVDLAVPLAAHVYDIRWRRTVAGTANTGIIASSHILVTTLEG